MIIVLESSAQTLTYVRIKAQRLTYGRLDTLQLSQASRTVSYMVDPPMLPAQT